MNSAAFDIAEFPSPKTLGQKAPRLEVLRRPESWDSEKYAQGQMRGLVRRVFLSEVPSRVRQIVVSAIEVETTIQRFCRAMGEVLSMEAEREVVVVEGWKEVPRGRGFGSALSALSKDANGELRQDAMRIGVNLWSLSNDGGESLPARESLQTYLWQIRREFEYSILVAKPLAFSNEAATIAACSDGMILVLSALRTRRATALSVKQNLDAARVRLLGTVLGDREFPIPDRIYRRL